MGPAILLDKSTLQSLSRDAVRELTRYFTLNVPPILVAEILGDLQKHSDDEERSHSMVQSLAYKASPPDAVVNAHYQPICVNNLLGGLCEMDGRPLLAGARPIKTKDGRYGTYTGVQPENEALCRWMAGNFDQIDSDFAQRWRHSASSFDLEVYKHSLGKLDYKIQSLDELGTIVDRLLDLDDLQIRLLDTFIDDLRTLPEVKRWSLSRWHNGEYLRLNCFAPYVYHCIRVNTLFYLGVSHGLIGTRPTNRIDLEYFYYSPFACIFSSGDKVHHQLSNLVLRQDQSYVHRDKLMQELNTLAADRIKQPHIEPKPGSIIVSMWEKHWKGFHPQAQPRRSQSKEEQEETMKMLKPILDAMHRDSEQQPRPPRWPA